MFQNQFTKSNKTSGAATCFCCTKKTQRLTTCLSNGFRIVRSSRIRSAPDVNNPTLNNPSGLIRSEPAQLPSNRARIARVVPHEGQGNPVIRWKRQGLNEMTPIPLRTTQINPAGIRKRINREELRMYLSRDVAGVWPCSFRVSRPES